MKRFVTVFASLFVLLPAHSLLAAPKVPKKFASPVVTKGTPGHQVAIEIDITGAKQLYLEVNSGGNGSSYDWADWIEPTLIGPKGEKRLTDLKWSKLDGRAHVGKNQEGGPLRVAGKLISNGIGTHADSVLYYKLPAGYTRFRARGGLDNGGTDQNGSTTSLQFRVYTTATAKFRSPPPVKAGVKSPPGFAVESIFSGGVREIGSWVVLCVDHKGRLIASDRQGPLYRITVPPPGDKDGETKVEKLPVAVGHANGLLDAFGSLFVVGKGKGKSGLFRLTDTNGDDHYDKVEHLMSLTVGGDHHAHAVIVGPTGKRLYILCGNSTNPPDKLARRKTQHQSEDHLLPRSTYYGHNTGRLAPGGFVVTCKPDGTDRQLHCTGFRNPYDIVLNRAGELFTFDADMEYDVGGPWYRATRINHCVSGGEFGWRFGAGKWPNYFPDTVGTVTDIGRGSPTGVVFGYGAKFPAKYQRALFACDWTYGRIYAVHMKEDGASYSGEVELFLSGRGMPVSDVVIHPTDGAMYYITGGRRNKTTLFRVTYTGDESTKPISATPTASPARDARRKLEALHGIVDAKTVDAAWPHLSSTDRRIRYAARTAIEHQPAEQWASRALAEKNPLAVIESVVALARTGDKKHQASLIKLCNGLDPTKLKLEQQLDLLRAYSLVFIRMGAPDETTARTVAARFAPLYPSGVNSLDRELCQMLLYLKSPGAVSKTVKLLLAAQTQADQMFYGYHLRTIKDGWSNDDLKAYFTFIRRAETNRGDYTGGGHFSSYLRMIRSQATKRLSASQRTAVASVIKAAASKPVSTFKPGPLVRKWTVKDLKPFLSEVETGRSFIRGKTLYNGMCAKCHLFKGKGGALGPDLSSVGNKYKYEALLTEILEPSKVISDPHASVIVQLKNGKVLTGREVGGDDKILKLAMNPNKPEEIIDVVRAEIDARKKSPVSMMPSDQLNTLRKEEIFDLLMYLSSGGRLGHTAFQQ
jgi:putative heme-binding domain-containing protein